MWGADAEGARQRPEYMGTVKKWAPAAPFPDQLHPEDPTGERVLVLSGKRQVPRLQSRFEMLAVSGTVIFGIRLAVTELPSLNASAACFEGLTHFPARNWRKINWNHPV